VMRRFKPIPKEHRKVAALTRDLYAKDVSDLQSLSRMGYPREQMLESVTRSREDFIVLFKDTF
jgi:hypothetical protein